MHREQRVEGVRRQFTSRVRPIERDEHGLLRFFEWLIANCPELLAVGKEGDPLGQLRKDLAGLYK